MRSLFAAIVFVLASAAQPLAASSAFAPSDFVASGGLTTNVDGSTTFEFRLDNQRDDVAVTGATVTVTFFNVKPETGSRVAEYHWSFAGPVPPKGQLLDYGKLTTSQTSDLVARYAKVDPGFRREQLEFVTYSYSARVDAVSAVVRP